MDISGFYILSGFSTHSKLVGGFCLRICGLECDCQELTQRVGSESNVEETTYSSSDCQEEETQRAASEEVGGPGLGCPSPTKLTFGGFGDFFSISSERQSE